MEDARQIAKEKKTVLITGASSGIGRAAALALAREGWNVVAGVRSPAACGDICDPEKGGSASIQLVQLDVTRKDDVRHAVEAVMSTTDRIDLLVNNAGYGSIGLFEKATDEDIRAQFDVNLFGAMRMAQAVLPHMRRQRNGMIMNISSMGGRITFPLYSVYHASKWALEGWSESLQYELEPLGIRVKLIEPGAIKTDFYKRSRRVFDKQVDGAQREVYEEYEEDMMEELEEAGQKGSSAEVVAQKIVRVAQSSSRRLRYPVGGYASVYMKLRWLLPQRVFAAIVKKALD